MRIIRIFDIILAYVFVVVCALALVAGCFNWRWFILSGAMLAAYFIWDILMLRCPWCGGFINLDRLLHAWRHQGYCSSCGHEITVARRKKWTPKRPQNPADEEKETDQ